MAFCRKVGSFKAQQYREKEQALWGVFWGITQVIGGAFCVTNGSSLSNEQKLWVSWCFPPGWPGYGVGYLPMQNWLKIRSRTSSV